MSESDKRAIQNIVIIGAQGGMGRFFRKRFEQMGYRVQGLDRPLGDENIAGGITGADLVLLTVPIKSMQEVLDSLQGHLSAGAILADICSVKVKPLRLMLRSHPGPVVGLHPLFGPEPDQTQPLKIALVPGRDAQARQRLEGLLQSIDCRSFETSAEEHDQAMALIQGLNFVTTVSYLSATSEGPGLEKFLTPSFSRRLQAARKMLTEDRDLFQDLFEANPFSQDAVRSFRAFLNLAAAGELDLLNNKACWWWRDTQEKGGT